MNEMLKGLGSEYVIPVVLVTVGAWVAKFLFEVGSSRRSQRKEFLELWKPEMVVDDLQLEVVVRHLTGEYMPAKIIRRILPEAFPSRRLLDLASVWGILDYDDSKETLTVRKQIFDAFVGPEKLFNFLYFAAAIAGFLCIAMIFMSENRLMQFIWAINALMLIGGAFGSLGRSEAFKSWRLKGDRIQQMVNPRSDDVSAVVQSQPN